MTALEGLHVTGERAADLLPWVTEGGPAPSPNPTFEVLVLVPWFLDPIKPSVQQHWDCRIESGGCPLPPILRSYLTESVYKVVLEKSIPAQIRQRVLYNVVS